MGASPKRTATTYGELRKLLHAAGDPWEPDPTKADEELLPELPTGGDGLYEPRSRTITSAGLDELLRDATPPSNPDLRAVWREAGLLLDEEVAAPSPKGRSTKKAADTPAPDSGG